MNMDVKLQEKCECRTDSSKFYNSLMNGDFRMKGECAVSLLLTKLDIVNVELSMERKRTVIQTKTGRLKSFESTCKKMKKKGLELNFPTAVERINDLIGVRAVCSYVDDIYAVADVLEQQSDIRILKKKDYIQNPKNSGYRSLHLILEIPIVFKGGTQWVKMELQLRTAAMDYWANLDHQLRYKKRKKESDEIDEELRQCAEVVDKLDKRMLEIRRKIDKL